MKFNHDAIVGFEDDYVWENEEGDSFIFSDDNSGVMDLGVEIVDFTWKINNKGILLIKTPKENRFWVLSSVKSGVFIIDVYKRVGEKLHKVESLSLTKKAIEEPKEELGLLDALKGFDDGQKAYLFIINLLAFVCVFLGVFFLPVINNFGFFVKVGVGLTLLGAVFIKSIPLTIKMPITLRDRLSGLLS